MVAFVIAGFTVLVFEMHRADEAESRLAKVLEPDERIYVPESADRIASLIEEARWTVRDTLAATFVGKWARGTGRVGTVVASKSSLSVVVYVSQFGRSERDLVGFSAQ